MAQQTASAKINDLDKLKMLIQLMAETQPQPQGEVTIMRQGEQIILPPGMEIPEAIKWLEKQFKADSKMIHFCEPIEGYPLDAARAVGLAIKQIFGYRDCVESFWPPAKSIGLEIDAEGNTEQVYVGQFKLPNVEGEISLVPTGPMQLTIDAEVAARFQPKMKELAVLARQILRTNSAYRGKAFKLRYDNRHGTPEQPKFIKIGTLGQLQLNRDIRDLLQAAVWTPIMKSDRCRAHRIPLKRGILLEGPYGTGKSLFATETATVANKYGWTYIYLEDIRWLAQAYEFAAFYAPSVLFAEDIDTLVDASGELPENIRNVIDAVNTKTNEIILVLTTNHVEKLPKSMLRHGRLDTIVPFRAPDAETVEILLRQYAGSLLNPLQNVQQVRQKLAGRNPSVIREVVERAKLQMVTRDFQDDELLPDDLMMAAESMAYHIQLQEAVPPTQPSVAELFGTGFGKGAGGWFEKCFAEMMLKVTNPERYDEDCPPDLIDIQEVIQTNGD